MNAGMEENDNIQQTDLYTEGEDRRRKIPHINPYIFINEKTVLLEEQNIVFNTVFCLYSSF